MNKISAVAAAGVLLFALLSCRVMNRFTGDQNLKKVGTLWNDVPQMDGLESSEAEMPFYVKLLMRTALNNLYRLNNENEDRTHATGDWAVFKTTKKPEDVQNFYTNDRMTSFGKWDANKKSTCLNGKDNGFAGVACVFTKSIDRRPVGLLIVAAQDDKKKDTNLFFIRVEADEAPATSKPANTK